MAALAPLFRSMNHDPQIAVLDTNVVLDWLLFGNPQCAVLQQALTTSALRWVATAEMRNELRHVLAHGRLNRWHPDLPLLDLQWDKYCVEMPAPPPASHATRLRCTDAETRSSSTSRWHAAHAGCSAATGPC